MADPTVTNAINGTSSVASTVVTFGFTAAAGSLIVLTVGADAYRSGSPSGYTLSTGMAQETYMGSYLWWKIAAGTETSVTYVVGSTAESEWTLTTFDNIDATPYDGSPSGQFVVSGASSYTTQTVTPTTGRRMLLAIIAGARDPAVITDVNAWINSFTEINQSFQNVSVTGNITGVAWRIVDGDGSTSFSTGASYVGGFGEARVGQIIAFKVAAAGGAIADLATKVIQMRNGGFLKVSGG